MKRSLLILLCLCLLCGLTGCREEAAPAPELLEPVEVEIDTHTVGYGDVYDVSILNGEVIPYVEEVGFLTDGRLGEICVAVGDTVKKGQVLATLDDTATNNRIDALVAELLNTRTLGEFSDRQLELDIAIAEEQLLKLQESQASVQTCQAQEIEIEQLKAKLRQEKELRQLSVDNINAELLTLREQLTLTEITAPFDGQVVYTSPTKSGYPVAGFTPIVCVADESRLQISSDYISDYLISISDRVYARVLDRDYEITYQSMDMSDYLAMALSGRKKTSKFTFDAPDSGLESGQYAAVMVMNSCREDVLTIPSNALYQDSKGYYVYIVEDGERSKLPIRAGVVTGVNVEVLEGLQEGDVVYVKE